MTTASATIPRDARFWIGMVFLVAVALTVISYGSASTVQINLAALTFALIAMSTLGRPIGARRVARVQTTAIVVIAVLLAYAALQTVPFSQFANPAWRSVRDNLAPVAGTISVAPGMTLEALTALALPFLVFIAALSLFQGDAETLLLWRALAYFGAGYAVFGILQELLLRDQILLDPKKFYVGSLTATFINRNTAGTFFGVAFLLNFGLGFFYLRRVRVRALAKKASNFAIGLGDKYGMVVIHAFACLVIAVALFLTQSRGAVGATFVAAALATSLMMTRKLTADKETDDEKKDRAPWRRFTTIAGGLIALVGFFALFAGRSTYRMEEQGADDARWCAFGSTIKAIRDNWLLGTGFGAFEDTFRVYRDETCAGIFGVWERAHNFFLEGYLGLGLAFAVALVIAYVVLGRALMVGVRTRRRFRFVPVMALSALVLVSAHSLVDFSLQIPGFSVYFAAVLASAVAISLERLSAPAVPDDR
jgi:hypothetical protein